MNVENIGSGEYRLAQECARSSARAASSRSAWICTATSSRTWQTSSTYCAATTRRRTPTSGHLPPKPRGARRLSAKGLPSVPAAAQAPHDLPARWPRRPSSRSRASSKRLRTGGERPRDRLREHVHRVCVDGRAPRTSSTVVVVPSAPEYEEYCAKKADELAELVFGKRREFAFETCPLIRPRLRAPRCTNWSPRSA